jgi:hypothetical protein
MKKFVPKFCMTCDEPEASSYPVIIRIIRADAAITAAKFLKIKSPVKATFLERKF